MIGLDTNVLVRYIVQDDAQQSALATQLIESLTVDAPGYVSLVALVELVWVLSRCYASDKPAICNVLETLLRTREIVVADAELVWRALRRFKDGGADFSDCLIERAGNAAGCDYTASFDRGAVRDCGMQLLT
ncbi:type II toxin-antitoxin system VapC family toxin [Uliginosibacterium sediminicola]|uniref:Type II toxin-antitoxin system VapC family toxin n=1 Tax=Uliginosibacterium sediminicola TaxID=2024550 RepID=A0ABU9Z142_9RHOO